MGDRRLRLGAICATAADWATMKLYSVDLSHITFERPAGRTRWLGKLNDNQWTLLRSDQLGQQRWKEEGPPIAIGKQL